MPSQPGLVSRERDGLEDVLGFPRGAGGYIPKCKPEGNRPRVFLQQSWVYSIQGQQGIAVKALCRGGHRQVPTGKGRISFQSPGRGGLREWSLAESGGREGDSPVPCGALLGFGASSAPMTPWWFPQGFPSDASQETKGREMRIFPYSCLGRVLRASPF